MKARRLVGLCFAATLVCVVGALTLRIWADPQNAMSRQTMVLLFPVFAAMLAIKSVRYPRAALGLALTSAGLAVGALMVIWSG